MQEYSYRKEFGLSYDDFINEPWDSFLINSFIINHLAEMQRQESKSMERKARRSS